MAVQPKSNDPHSQSLQYPSPNLYMETLIRTEYIFLPEHDLIILLLSPLKDLSNKLDDLLIR